MNVCTMKNGSTEIVTDDKDLIEIIARYCGDDIADLVDNLVTEHNEYLDTVTDAYNELWDTFEEEKENEDVSRDWKMISRHTMNELAHIL